MNQTSPQKKGPSLKKLIEGSESKSNLNRFEDSKQDKSSILELSQIPKLRNKLESLKVKDRFASRPKHGDSQSLQAGQGLEAYLDSQRFKARAGIRNPQSIVNSVRPFSNSSSEEDDSDDRDGSRMQSHQNSSQMTGYESKAQRKEL